MNSVVPLYPSPLAGEGGSRSETDERACRVADAEWLKARAREMRREPAHYERMLWRLLRDRRLGEVKFRRQVVVGDYIADFLCFEHRLIIEADGGRHEPGSDDERDAWLTSQGFRVLRFSNQMIETRAHEVVGAIKAACGPPHPSPLAGEGGSRSETDEG
ncbi:endonuclease domain-containing protein [Brevundimonas vesicularis]|uniref:endonuclease domain-containing protein n=1 Tax=Brevundimonas vesicularis TaxID=41276 RepID=UPI0038D48755